jgi:hypothetical protein
MPIRTPEGNLRRANTSWKICEERSDQLGVIGNDPGEARSSLRPFFQLTVPASHLPAEPEESLLPTGS